MADSSVMRIGYAVESVWGTTPATALKIVPVTGFSWGYAKETFRSERHHGDPQIRKRARQGHHSAPSFRSELSFGDLDDFLAVFARSAWAGDVLENGVLLPSMTLEAQHSDISKFVAAKGCRPNTLNISVQKGSMVRCDFSFMGLAPVSAGVSVGTGAAIEPPDEEPYAGVESITLLEEGGTTLADVLGLEISINNASRVKSLLADPQPLGIGLGEFEVGGSLQLYFEDTELLDKVWNHERSSLELELTDGAGNLQRWLIHRYIYSGGSPDSEGAYSDIEMTLPFEAEKDPITAKTIRITRQAGS